MVSAGGSPPAGDGAGSKPAEERLSGGDDSPAGNSPAAGGPLPDSKVPRNTPTRLAKRQSPPRVSTGAGEREGPRSLPPSSTGPPKESAGARPKEYHGARPKERTPVGTPTTPQKADAMSTASSVSMSAQQGSFSSSSEISFSPSGGDLSDALPQRYSGSTEEEGERERHQSHHWHLPFRKKVTIVEPGVEAACSPKEGTLEAGLEFGSPPHAEGGEHAEQQHREPHRSSIGHAISHSSIGRAVSHSSIGHAVSHFFKKGHHSPPGSGAEGSEKLSFSPPADGGVEVGSPSSHHSIGHIVSDFFRKGHHRHSPPAAGARGSASALEEASVVCSSPSADAVAEDGVFAASSAPARAIAGAAAAADGVTSAEEAAREHHSIASMGHVVARAFKKLNTSLVGSPGRPPRWKTWRRATESDPKSHRYRRKSAPGRRHSESAAGSYDATVLSLLRRRRSASRSPEARRRASSPSPDRDAALQRLRRQALRRHRPDFLHKRLWRRSCPDLSTATPTERERVRPPILHVVLRRALIDEEERILLCYDHHLPAPPIQAFEWVEINQEDESQIYIKFFKFHKCYDLIPTSAKLVVFDTQLLVKKAFFALVYNGVRAAPLWDSSKQQFVGMLTITDFIRILQMYYRNSDERIEELEEHKLETWRTVLESDSKPLIYIEPEASLYEAITTLLKNRIHRLPVIDPVSGDVLYIITHKRILRFLCLYIHNLPRPTFLSRTLADLRIGTFDRIETARPDTPVIEALTKFVERRVSALPIVDADNKLTHIYAKFDVINLAAEKTYNNLNVPLMTANSHRSENKVEACRLSDTLAQVLEKIVHAEVHRLVITDDDQHVIGIISLSDILDALVIRPHEYNTLPDTPSGSEAAGDDENHMIVEEEPGDEEEPVAAAAGVAHLSLSGHKDG